MSNRFHWHHRGEISMSLLILPQRQIIPTILLLISTCHLGHTHLPSHCSHWLLIPSCPMLCLHIHHGMQVPRTLTMCSNPPWLPPNLQDQSAGTLLQGCQQSLWLHLIKIMVAAPLKPDHTVHNPDHHPVLQAIGMAKGLMMYNPSLMKNQARSLVFFVGKLLISQFIFKTQWLIKLTVMNGQQANVNMSSILLTPVVQQH